MSLQASTPLSSSLHAAMQAKTGQETRIKLVEGLLWIEDEEKKRHLQFSIAPYSGQKRFRLCWRFGERETFTLIVSLPYRNLILRCVPVRARKGLLEAIP